MKARKRLRTRLAETIKRMRGPDSSIRAVVLRIESPGGSSLASDVMWRELRLLGQAKPLIVSMGSVAASGGYYAASASRDIYPLSHSGDGVHRRPSRGRRGRHGLLEKIGVTVDTYKTTPRADVESFFRGFTEDERHLAEHVIDQLYENFLDRVAQGRGMKKEDIDAVGRGRVWTGQQALDRAPEQDHLGGLRDALADARSQAYLPDDAPVVEYPPQSTSLLDLALKLAGAGGNDGVAMPASIEALPLPCASPRPRHRPPRRLPR